MSGVWAEESIKVCLYLFLGLLPVDHRLIHELANIYTAAVADIKRTILRVLETPVCTKYQLLVHLRVENAYIVQYTGFCYFCVVIDEFGF